MSTKEDRNIVPIKDEIGDDYSNDDLYNISSWGADLSFRELITMYQEDELVKPEMQRHYVWDKTEASRFIESLLMGLPIPSIFLAKTNSEKKLIVDGYQRIMTVYDYVRGIFSKDNKVFKLSNSQKINPRWRGKAFSELPEDAQRKIKSTTIHAIIFEQKHPTNDDTSLYQVFERINTSGRTLMPQEIRNCVYQGKFNSLLINLNKYPAWRKLYGLTEVDSRMRDIEFILRFFGLSIPSIREKESGKISLKKHLNEVMKSSLSEQEDILNDRDARFKKTIDFLLTNIGISSFHNISEKDRKPIPKFHPTIFDSIAIATDYALQGNPDLSVKGLSEKRIKLLADEQFKTITRFETMNIERINGRILLALKFLYSV